MPSGVVSDMAAEATFGTMQKTDPFQAMAAKRGATMKYPVSSTVKGRVVQVVPLVDVANV